MEDLNTYHILVIKDDNTKYVFNLIGTKISSYQTNRMRRNKCDCLVGLKDEDLNQLVLYSDKKRKFEYISCKRHISNILEGSIIGVKGDCIVEVINSKPIKVLAACSNCGHDKGKELQTCILGCDKAICSTLCGKYNG